MRGRRSLFGFTVVLAGACTVAAVVFSVQGRATANVAAASRPWATRDLPGSVKLTGQVPLAVAKIPGAAAAHRAGYVRPHPKSADIGLSFAFPLRDKAGARPADRAGGEDAPVPHPRRSSTRASRRRRAGRRPSQLADRAAASTITHVGADRHGDHGVRADGGRREGAARQDQRLPPAGLDLRQACKVAPYQFYSNTTAPTVPARFGVQTHLRPERRRPLLHAAQLSSGADEPVSDCGDDDNAVISPLCVDVRSGGYFPADLRGLYDITGHGYRRHRPDDRLHALDRRRAAGGDDHVRDRHRRPADHGRPELRRDGQLADDAELVHDADGRARPPADRSSRTATRPTTTSARTSRRRSTSRRPTASRRTSA